MNGGVRFLHRDLYLHDTSEMCALGDKLARYHKFVQMARDAFWMPTHHQHILAGEQIALQCKPIT